MLLFRRKSSNRRRKSSDRKVFSRNKGGRSSDNTCESRNKRSYSRNKARKSRNSRQQHKARQLHRVEKRRVGKGWGFCVCRKPSFGGKGREICSVRQKTRMMNVIVVASTVVWRGR